MVDYSISPDWLQKHASKKVEHSRHLVCPSKAKHISAIFLGSSSKREARNESWDVLKRLPLVGEMKVTAWKETSRKTGNSEYRKIKDQMSEV